MRNEAKLHPFATSLAGDEIFMTHYTLVATGRHACVPEHLDRSVIRPALKKSLIGATRDLASSAYNFRDPGIEMAAHEVTSASDLISRSDCFGISSPTTINSGKLACPATYQDSRRPRYGSRAPVTKAVVDKRAPGFRDGLSFSDENAVVNREFLEKREPRRCTEAMGVP